MVLIEPIDCSITNNDHILLKDLIHPLTWKLELKLFVSPSWFYACVLYHCINIGVFLWNWEKESVSCKTRQNKHSVKNIHRSNCCCMLAFFQHTVPFLLIAPNIFCDLFVNVINLLPTLSWFRFESLLNLKIPNINYAIYSTVFTTLQFVSDLCQQYFSENMNISRVNFLKVVLIFYENAFLNTKNC